VNLQQLHALLTKAKELCQHQEYVIVGSLSILGSISQPPREMVMSIDVDTYIKNDPGRTTLLQQPLGQGSVFEDVNGYYLDPVSPNLPSFPQGWQERLKKVDFGDVTAYFVDPNDAAVSKYMRGEDRDLRWCRAGLKSALLNIHIIEQRIASAPCLDGELQAARIRIAKHKKSLKLEN
jgi:hypothetical protein